MEDSEGDRYSLKGARVYLHVTMHGGERFVHLDVDHPDLNKIFAPQESSYAGGRKGGIYIGFRPPQSERAEAYLKGIRPDA